MKKRHYMILTAFAVLVAIYLLMTEVAGRWSESVSAYNELTSRESLIAPPETLAVRRAELRRKEAELRRELSEAAGSYSRSFSGFLSLSSREALASHVTLAGALPLPTPQGKERERDEHFRLQLTGEFHRVAGYINRLENSPLEVRFGRVLLRRGSGRAGLLDATLEGSFPARE